MGSCLQNFKCLGLTEEERLEHRLRGEEECSGRRNSLSKDSTMGTWAPGNVPVLFWSKEQRGQCVCGAG